MDKKMINEPNREMDPPVKEQDTYQQILSSLVHPIRRGILRELSQGSRSYTELLEQQQIASSQLAYHLGILGALLIQEHAQYRLSRHGIAALALMHQVEEGENVNEENTSYLKGNLTLRVAAAIDRDEYGWIKGDLRITGHHIIFTSAPFYPEEQLVIPREHLLDLRYTPKIHWDPSAGTKIIGGWIITLYYHGSSKHTSSRKIIFWDNLQLVSDVISSTFGFKTPDIQHLNSLETDQIELE